MDILNHLWHGQFGNFSQDDIEYIFNPELAALYLCANADNYNQLLDLASYPAKDLYSLQKAQFSTIFSLQAKMINLESVKFYLNELQILNPGNILKLLNNLPALNDTDIKHSTALNNAQILAQNVRNLLDENLQNLLDLKSQQIKNGDYKMAFAGCFNAGKSSLINALLDDEILKASNAPETAAISILRQGEPKALISYYSQEEFELIKQQAKLSPECAKLLDNCEFVELENEEISLNELTNFTSASSAKSNQVKQIEIFFPNELLNANISLVDTPGLDDIIISREQTSRKLLASADEIFYLCSATQALSSKDCEFLLQFISENPAIKISILLTKTDLILESELASLEAYVREKFNTELTVAGLKSNFELFSVCAANNHGIAALKNYIKSRSNAKNKLFAKQLTAALIGFLNTQIHTLNTQIQADLSQQSDEKILLEEQNKRIQTQNALLDEQIANLESVLQNLTNYKIINPQDRYLLAKRLASKISSEYEYSSKFTKTNAKTLAVQEFSDFMMLKNAASFHFYEQIIQTIQKIRPEINVQIVRSSQFSSDDFNSAVDKFDVLKKSNENDMQSAILAILNNLNLEQNWQKTAADTLKNTLNEAILTLTASKQSQVQIDQNSDDLAIRLKMLKELLAQCKEQA